MTVRTILVNVSFVGYIRWTMTMITKDSVLRVALAALCAGAAHPIAAQTLVESGTVKLVYDLSNKRLPTWTGGYLISIENVGQPVQTIHTFDPTGRELTPIVFSLPGTNAMRIEDSAVAPAGTHVLCGQAYDKSGAGSGFVSWVSTDGQNVKTVRLFPYVPFHMAVDSDGTIWLQGAETVNQEYTDPAINPDHGLIRHFDRNGIEIGSYIPRSKVPGLSAGLEIGAIAAANGRVGWYADRAHVYYEVTASGSVAAYRGFAPSKSQWKITGLAMTGSGDVVVSALERVGSTGAATRIRHMFYFDRANRAWVELAMPAGTSVRYPVILGGDGKRLAMFAGTSAVTFFMYSSK